METIAFLPLLRLRMRVFRYEANLARTKSTVSQINTVQQNVAMLALIGRAFNPPA
jgi:hypothetical protein